MVAPLRFDMPFRVIPTTNTNTNTNTTNTNTTNTTVVALKYFSD